MFTLTLGGETIELRPMKNWSQLDHYKWTPRGILPAEPAGLEIAIDHVRIVGETVAVKDPAGCEKLERLFNDWLTFEKETLELARKSRIHHPPTAAARTAAPPSAPELRFRVEADKLGQVHIQSVRGKEVLASIGLSVAGFNSLHHQALMRKPHTLQTGALHDWVELDGELYSFEKGRNDAARLERSLNERYIPAVTAGHSKEVLILLNAASPTGFDIQFPVLVGGAPEIRRHHLDDHSLELLQDPDHCGLLRKDILAKLIPPNLVFKQKTPDGGEQYLPWTPETSVNFTDDEGHQGTIRLSQPLNLLRLTAAELTAAFNHPAIHRYARVPGPSPGTSEFEPAPAPRASLAPAQPALPTSPCLSQPAFSEASARGLEPARVEPLSIVAERAPELAVSPGFQPIVRDRLPNLWLKEVLTQPALQHDWFACLAYGKMAERFGNSTQGMFGPAACWFITLGESMDIDDPAFKGILLTEKGSLGFLNQGHMARFYNGVAFLGTQKSVLEGIDVTLAAVGLDAQQRVAFLLSENFRRQFGIPETILNTVLNRLSELGAVIMSISEALTSHEPLEVVWTVPADQPDPTDPQAVEIIRA